MLRVPPSRWDTRVQASSIGSTSASSENPRCAMYKHCGRPCDLFAGVWASAWTVRNPFGESGNGSRKASGRLQKNRVGPAALIRDLTSDRPSLGFDLPKDFAEHAQQHLGIGCT